LAILKITRERPELPENFEARASLARSLRWNFSNAADQISAAMDCDRRYQKKSAWTDITLKGCSSGIYGRETLNGNFRNWAL
jgi:hypothetical protein